MTTFTNDKIHFKAIHGEDKRRFELEKPLQFADLRATLACLFDVPASSADQVRVTYSSLNAWTAINNDKDLQRVLRAVEESHTTKPVRLHLVLPDDVAAMTTTDDEAPPQEEAELAAEPSPETAAEAAPDAVFDSAAAKLATMGIPIEGDQLKTLMAALDLQPRRLHRVGLVEGPTPGPTPPGRGGGRGGGRFGHGPHWGHHGPHGEPHFGHGGPHFGHADPHGGKGGQGGKGGGPHFGKGGKGGAEFGHGPHGFPPIPSHGGGPPVPPPPPAGGGEPLDDAAIDALVGRLASQPEAQKKLLGRLLLSRAQGKLGQGGCGDQLKHGGKGAKGAKGAFGGPCGRHGGRGLGHNHRGHGPPLGGRPGLRVATALGVELSEARAIIRRARHGDVAARVAVVAVLGPCAPIGPGPHGGKGGKGKGGHGQGDGHGPASRLARALVEGEAEPDLEAAHAKLLAAAAAAGKPPGKVMRPAKVLARALGCPVYEACGLLEAAIAGDAAAKASVKHVIDSIPTMGPPPAGGAAKPLESSDDDGAWESLDEPFDASWEPVEPVAAQLAATKLG